MKTLNQDIKDKNFKRVYLLFGDEPFLVTSFKKRLRDAIIGEDTMNYNYFEGKEPDVMEILELAETMPFFSERRLILVDGSGYFKESPPDALVDYISRIPETTCLIFCESAVDKRNRLYKRVKESGYAAELKRQDEVQLASWAAGILAKDGKKITRQVMSYFLGRVGNDMELIRQELEKLVCFTMGREVITKEDVDAVGSVHTESKVFEMVTAICSGNRKRAMELYKDLLALKEPPMRILYLIARQFNQLLQVKDLTAKGGGAGTVASGLKVSSYVAGKLAAQARPFEKKQLLSYVTACVELEEAVKTGGLQDRVAVELLISGRPTDARLSAD